MPRSNRARNQRPRAKNPAKSLAKVRAIALDMEEPLNDIENLIQALRFIGYGMESHYADEGAPISSLAWTAVQRLHALREMWEGMRKA